MFDHWQPWAFAGIILLIFGIVQWIARRDRIAVEKLLGPAHPLQASYNLWKYYRYEGGGVVESPYPMNEFQAVAYCGANLGRVQYVDRTHHFIFYRPK